MSKTWQWIWRWGWLAIWLTACGLGGNAPAPTPTPPAFKVGLLTSGSVNDKGWNQLAYEALQRMEQEVGAQVSNLEAGSSPAAYEKLLRDYASQGYAVVIAHGFEYQDAALAVAQDYPETWFFVSSSRVHEGRVLGWNLDSSQTWYLMGVIAASMGQQAGLVGGMEIPPIKASFTGFTHGAHSVNPDFPIRITYLGSWDDVGAAKEAALTLVADGADFVVPNADAAGAGVYQAAVEAGPGVRAFGVLYDVIAQAPLNIVANSRSNLGQGMINVVRQVKEGAFQPSGNIEFGLKDSDVMWLMYNDGAATPVPDDVRALVETAKQKIIAGEIDTKAPLP